MSDILKLETTEVAEFTAMQWGLNLQAAYERIAELSNVEEGYEERDNRVGELYEEKQALEQELEKAEERREKMYNFHNVVQTIVTPDTWEKIKESFDYRGYYDCL